MLPSSGEVVQRRAGHPNLGRSEGWRKLIDLPEDQVREMATKEWTRSQYQPYPYRVDDGREGEEAGTDAFEGTRACPTAASTTRPHH